MKHAQPSIPTTPLRLCAFGFLASIVACTSAKDNPSWVEDVKPLVQANCLRCHSSPAIDGAPTDFRLDRYEDTVMKDGRVVLGAAAMVAFVSARAGVDGTMPPAFPRSQSQRDTFIHWQDQVISNDDARPTLGARSANASPTAKLLSTLQTADSADVTLDIEVADGDGDLVTGSLHIADRIINDDLQSGRSTTIFSPATLPAGKYPIVARITDDLAAVNRTVGELTVEHENGNTAPSLVWGTSLRDALIADLQSPFSLRVTVTDPDSADVLSVDIKAVRGRKSDGSYREEIPVANDLPVVDGQSETDWDTTMVPPGTGWRLLATASDGTATTTILSSAFLISHSTTELRFADVEPLLVASCQGCHPRFGIPGLPHNFAVHEDSNVAKGVDSLRGVIYRRVILEANMPPVSAATILSEGWRSLTESERQQLKEYLLGGSPQ